MKTFGWDTVFVVREDRLNALLVANADQTTLAFSTNLPSGESDSASGKFAPWQIAQGGSNEIIHLKLPIETGTMKIRDQSFDLAGLTLVVATYLEWLTIAGDKESLRFDYNKLGKTGNRPERGELTVIKLLDPNQVLSPQDNAILSFSLGQYLVANADAVRFVFATVNLVAPATNSWLTPVKNAYGYFHREGLDAGFLAIFSVTTDRDISNLEKTVDPTAIPVDTNATFVISTELFLTKVIAPGLAKSFSTGVESFTFEPVSQTLRNNRNLSAKAVKSGAIWYYPIVEKLEIRSGENAIETYSQGKADMYAGIWLYFNVSARNAALYSPTDGALTFLNDPNPVESHTADIPWWFFIAGLIVIAITEIVVAVISGELATDISEENKERLAFGKHPPSSILIGADGPISVSNMGVNSALYLNATV